MNKDRNVTIDMLRGICAICVVLGHSIQRGMITGYEENILFKIIYTFHMPLFMLLSGYTLSLTEKKYDFKFIKKKFYRLIIPTIIWSYLLYFIRNFWFVGLKPFIELPDSIIQFSKNLLLHPDTIIWFLYIVFLCTFIFYIGKNVTKNWEI